jgi:hypothetical protein
VADKFIQRLKGRIPMRQLIKALVGCALALALAPAFAQTKPVAADTMQILREKLKGDKKVVVALNMDLTEAEGKTFWPIYDEYQKDLAKLNKRTADLIQRYAREYNAGAVKNDEARKMMDDFLDIEADENKRKREVVAKLNKVLSGKKMARYMQIEQKIRAVVKYELADSVPLVP